MTRYRLDLTAEQARALSVAAEFYARVLGMAQLGEVAHLWTRRRADGRPIDRERVRALTHELLEALAALPPGASFGLEDAPRACQVAYDVYQAIRHRLAVDADPPRARWSVDRDAPRLVCDAPLARIEGDNEAEYQRRAEAHRGLGLAPQIERALGVDRLAEGERLAAALAEIGRLKAAAGASR